MKEEKKEVEETPKAENPVLADIKKENAEMEAELQKRETFVRQREELKAREMIAGRSQITAQAQPETPRDYAKRVMSGKL